MNTSHTDILLAEKSDYITQVAKYNTHRTCFTYLRAYRSILYILLNILKWNTVMWTCENNTTLLPGPHPKPKKVTEKCF